MFNQKNKPKTILFLSANPNDTSRIRFDNEIKAIKAGLNRANQGGKFKLEIEFALNPKILQQSMRSFKPEIVHFSGHGTSSGILLEGNSGQSILVSIEALEGFFSLLSPTVECVVLNSCYSEYLAKAIAKHVKYVVGMYQEIGDNAAIEFAEGFYDALSAGESVERAFKFGVNAIKLASIPEHAAPVLIPGNTSTTFLDTKQLKKFGNQILTCSIIAGIVFAIFVSILVIRTLYGVSQFINWFSSPSIIQLPTPIVSQQEAATPTPISFSEKLTMVKAEASSFSQGLTAQPPDGAINGSIATNYNDSWLSAAGDLEGSWIKFTLPEVKVVTGMRLYFVADNPRGAQIKNTTLTFSDGSQQSISLPFKDGWQTIELPPILTTFVQLQIDALYGDIGVVEIREIELWGRTALPSDTAKAIPTKPVAEELFIISASSSSYSSGLTSQPPAGAINKSLVTNYADSWLSAIGDLVGAWIKLSLPEPRTVSRISLYFIKNNPRGAQIKKATLTFSDGSQQPVSFSFKEDGWQTIDLQPTHTEFVQIQIDELYGDIPVVEIREVRLFGYSQ